MTGRKGSQRGVTAPIDWAGCGTEANLKRHYRLNQKPCEKCRIKGNELASKRKARAKAKRDQERDQERAQAPNSSVVRSRTSSPGSSAPMALSRSR
jgi:hypothetical protein